MEKSHKHNVEEKKPGTKEYNTLYYPVYIKFNNRQT